MGNKRQVDIPLYVNDFVNDTPTKVSGRRRILDLDELSSVGDNDELIIQHGSRTYRTTKNGLLTPLLDAGTWDDYVSDLTAGGRGLTNPPTFEQFRTGIYANNFQVGDEMWITFHIQHDYKPGTDIYPHVHCATNAAAPQGNVKWQLDYTVAKRNDITPDTFDAITTVTVEAALTTQYGHVVTEVTDNDVIPSAQIEVDSLIMMRVARIADGASPTGDALDVFGLTVDLHYQKDRFGTPNKAPNFYE